jgi:serine/threonine protein phosphatase PrpC
MELIAAGLSDVGLQREHNEDSFCILPEFELFIVADGMGGHKAGDVASKMATHAIASFFQATASEDATWPFHFDPHLSVEENRLITGIKVANKKIFEASTRHREVQGMGTTVVGALFARTQQKLYVAHVGDSRCYRIRGNEITLLTRDHSLLNDYLLVMPDMTQQQKDELPKNVITRALGMQDTVVVDLVPEQPQVGDRYVLCSDGLSGMVADEEMLDVVGAAGGDLDRAVRGLVERANQAGGEDNITVVVVAVTDNASKRDANTVDSKPTSALGHADTDPGATMPDKVSSGGRPKSEP